MAGRPAKLTLNTEEDRALIRDVLQGRASAWTVFAERIADTLWTAARLLTPDDIEARTAFGEIIDGLRVDGFRRLRAYDGSSRIETFTALVARDLLAERLMRRLRQDPPAVAWNAFERFFQSDITRLIARRLPGPDHEQSRQDAYQDICLALLADDCRRLRQYKGIGSFGGFVLHVIDRLLVDFIRSTWPRRRRSETAAPEELDGLASDAPSPEAAILAQEEEQSLAVAAEVLRRAADTLSAAERLYLSIALGGGAPIPAREVARLMSRPVAEIYKLRQRVLSRLYEALDKHPAIKKWRATV